MKTTILTIIALGGIYAHADCAKYFNDLYEKDVANAEVYIQGDRSLRHQDMTTSLAGGPVAGAILGGVSGAEAGSVSSTPGVVVGGASGAALGFAGGFMSFMTSNLNPDDREASTANLEMAQVFLSAESGEDTLNLHAIHAKLKNDYNIEVSYSQVLAALRTVNGTCGETGNDSVMGNQLYLTLIKQLRTDGALR